MSATRPNLPDFENPPVVEVALSVQFQPLPLRTAHVGLLWNQFREWLPRTEDKPPLGHVVEDLGPNTPRQRGVRIEAMQAPPLLRTWFMSDSGTELIQVQPDRFVHNWRKGGEGEAYPRYERIRDAFHRELGVLRDFLSRERLGELRFDQCELTYVNHIVAGEGWLRHGQASNVFRSWSRTVPTGFSREPEDVTLTVRYPIHMSDDLPVGRLTVAIQPGWRASDSQPLYEMNLTARGAPLRDGIDGAFAFLDLGREWIVRGFAALTTSTMHSIWRRLDRP